MAYDAWCDVPGVGPYAVYRAAEDRADAAEQALAGCGPPVLVACAAPTAGGPRGNRPRGGCVEGGDARERRRRGANPGEHS